MSFGERLREVRLASKMDQATLARESGISLRSISKYENNKCQPRSIDSIRKLASVLCTTPERLIGLEELTLMEASERGGSRARRDLEVLSAQVSGLFAGGDVDEADVDAAMLSIQKAYWMAKEKNKKYTPKKYRQDATDGTD